MKNHTHSLNFIKLFWLTSVLLLGSFFNLSAANFIAVNPPPTTPVIIATGSTSFCSGDSVVLSVQAQPDVIGYVWSNGATTPTITVRNSGSFRVVVTTSDLITSDSSAAVLVSVNSVGSPLITANGSTSFCEGGSVQLVAAVTAPDTVASRILGTEIGDVYNCNCPQGYVAVGYQGNAGGVIDRFRLACKQLNADGTLGTAVVFSNTIGTSNGGSPSAVITAPAGEVLTSMRIRRNGQSLNEVGGSTSSITNLINADNSIASRLNGVISITAGGVADSVSIPAGHVIVGAEAYQNTLTYSGGFRLRTVPIASLLTNYLWSNGATTSTISVNTSGTYSAQVIAGACTSAASNAFAVTVNSIPSEPTISGDTSLCTGDSTVLTSSATSGNLWSTGDTTRTITVRNTGTFTVRQINGICTSETSLPITVTLFETASAPVITGDTAYCAGGSVVLTSSASNGNVWSTGDTTQTISVSTAGSYTVTVVNVGCVSPVSNAVTVVELPIPAIPTISTTDTLLCSGDSTVLTSSALMGNLWSTGDTTRSITVRNTGTFTVRQINGICTSANSSPVTVTLFETAAAPVITGDTAFCAGGSVVLTSSAINGNVWSTGDTTQTITVSAAGDFTVRVINGECTSPISNTFNVRELPTPAQPSISGDTTFCSGGSLVLTSSAINGNLWSTGDTTQSITVTAAGTYTVRQFLGICTSIVSEPKNISVINVSSAPIITGDTTFCAGSGGVTLTSSEPSNNVWSNGATTQSIIVSIPGVYTVRNISNSCTSLVSAPVTVSEIALPSTPTISGDTNFCPGSSTILTSSAISGNLWSTGDTSRSITVNQIGNYTVRVIANSCTSAVSDTVIVTSISAIPTPTISGDTNFCIGGSTILTSSATSGNVWSTGDTTRSITVITSGTYSVYQIIAGCTSAVSVNANVVQNALPAVPVIDAPVTQSICAFDSVQLRVTPQPDAVSYRWTNGAFGESIFVREGGIYQAFAVSATGCVSDTSEGVTVVVNNPGAAPSIGRNRDTNFCVGDSVILSVNVGTPIATLSNRIGNYADTLYSCDCPPGYVAVGFEAASGGLIDRFRLSCLQLNRNGTLGTTEVFSTPSAGSSTGGVTRAVSAGPAGSVLTSLVSRVQNNNILSVGGTSTPLASIRINTIDGRLPLTSVEGVFGGGIPDSAVAPSGHVIIGLEVSNNPSLYVGSYRLKTVPISTLLPNVIWSNGATTPTIGVRSAGTYTVRTILNGCTTQPSAPVTLTTNTIPVISGIPSLCGGNRTVLRSSIRTGNIWSTGAIADSIIVNSPGTYSVRNVQGSCTGRSVQVAVTIVPTPAAPTFTASILNIVEGDSAVLTIDNPVAGSDYIWSNGAVGTRIVLYAGDTISVIQSVRGCISTPSAETIITNLRGRNQIAFSMYPNPAKNQLYVVAPELEQISIVNAQGKVVLTQLPNPDGLVNINHLPKGMYLVKVQTKKGIGFSKLVKE